MWTYFALTGASFNFRLEDVLAEKEGKKSFYKTFLYFSVKIVCFKPRTGYYAVILGKKDCIKVPLPNPLYASGNYHVNWTNAD